MIGNQIIGTVLILQSIFGGFGMIGIIPSAQSTVAVANEVGNVVNALPTTKEEVEEYVKDFFADEPLLVEIAKCESTMTHITPAGTVVRGRVNQSDIGLMQINEAYHLQRATSLGLDIHTLEGNMAYARYLFEKEGVSPWLSSSKCWSKTDAYKELVVKN